MDQQFLGSVDQVAGRDIVNVTAQSSYWDWSIEDLQHQLGFYRKKLWDARLAIFFSIPSAWFVCGILGSIWLLLSGALFKIAGSFWMFGWLALALGVPSMWMAKIRQEKGLVIAYALREIAIINTVLEFRR